MATFWLAGVAGGFAADAPAAKHAPADFHVAVSGKDSNPGGVGGWSAPGIYLDGAPRGLGCKNYLLERNVIYRVHTPLFLYGCREGEVTQRENTFVKTGTPSADVLEAIQSKAGLEAAYRRRISSTDGRLKP